MTVIKGPTSLRVGVLGSSGKVGREICEAINRATDLELVAKVDVADSTQSLVAARAQIVVDFTHPTVVMSNLEFCIKSGIHAVVGTTGFSEARLADLRECLKNSPEVGVLIAPNFSIGALLMMRFAQLAAPHYESTEIVELHHPTKADAPSGTARRTAELVARARSAHGMDNVPDGTTTAIPGARGAVIDGIHVHAVRARGLVAHQEVILGGPGETLIIRHDSMDRSSFAPGVLAAVRMISQHPGLTVGLENLIDLG